MKRVFLFLWYIFLGVVIGFSQSENNKLITISGTVVDSTNTQVLEYATISIHKENDSLIGGVATNKLGEFNIKVTAGSYGLKIRFLSFQSKTIPLTSYKTDINLGLITLLPDNTLEEVKVIAEKDLFEVKFNKRIYNASLDILNKGGNALDVLNNTPSVRTDSEGVVVVRGEAATILVDGKPQFGLDTNTDILKSIPANSIDKVEIITRSAKYSASGGGAILNIITKKRLGKGFSGSIEAHIGTPDNHGFSSFLTEDSDKINLYSTISFNHSDNLKLTEYDQPSLGLFTRNNEDRIHNGALFNIGSEFYPNDKNIISTSFLVNFLNKNNFGNITGTDFLRKGTDKEDNSRIEAQIGYKRKFEKKGHELTTNFKYETTYSETNGRINESQILNDAIFQRTEKEQDLNNFDAQLDYVLPLNEKGVLNMGYRGTFRLYENEFLAEMLNNSIGDFETINNLDNRIGYDEIVHGIYGQYDLSFNKTTLSFGLRTEITNVQIKNSSENIEVKKNYTDLFPSLSLGLELSEKSYLSLSYARSIERPGIPQVSPFLSFTDERFQSVGNLDLNPYYNNYIELLFDTSFKKLSLTSSVFFNLNKNSFLTVFENSGMTTENGDIIFIRSIINSGDQNLYGFDVDLTYRPFNGLRLRAYVSPYREEIKETLDELYNIKNDVIYASGNAIVSLNDNLRANFGYIYQSTIKINGLREQRPLHWANLAVSKELFNDNATITFNANDLFASKKGRIISRESNLKTTRNIFYENQFNLSFTYRFNQKRKNKKDRSGEVKKDDLEDKQDRVN